MNPEISNEPYYSDNTSLEVYGVHCHCTAAHDTQNKKNLPTAATQQKSGLLRQNITSIP